MEKCIYCGEEANYQFKNKKWCCSPHMNGCEKIKEIRRIKTKESWDNNTRGKVNETEQKKIDGIIKCEYGCGNIAKFKTKGGRLICSKHSSSCEVNRKKNSDRMKELYITGKRDAKEIYKSIPEETKNTMAWSRGLTKETDDRVKKQGEVYSQRVKDGIIIHPWVGRKHKKKSKRKISIARTNFLTNHNNHNCQWFEIWNGRKNIKVQGTWEKLAAERLNELNIKWDRISIKFNGHRTFTPDFYLPDMDVYIEVKGYIRERDKYKMWTVIKEKNIKILLIEKNEIKNINSLQIKNLIDFTKKYTYDEIDFSKFENNDKYII